MQRESLDGELHLGTFAAARQSVLPMHSVKPDASGPGRGGGSETCKSHAPPPYHKIVAPMAENHHDGGFRPNVSAH
jgi:hypothetical protein